MNSSPRFKNDGGRSAKEAMKIVEADLARLDRITEVWGELLTDEQEALAKTAEGMHARALDSVVAYVAVFVFTEKQLSARGPFASYEEAKACARTLSSDPEEALVVEVLSSVERVAAD